MVNPENEALLLGLTWELGEFTTQEICDAYIKNFPGESLTSSVSRQVFNFLEDLKRDRYLSCDLHSGKWKVVLPRTSSVSAVV